MVTKRSKLYGLNNVTPVGTTTTNLTTLLSKKAQLTLLNEATKAASKEEAEKKVREAEEEKKKKQEEDDKRVQRAADRKKKQEEGRKKKDEEKVVEDVNTNTNKFLMEMNNADNDLDIDSMNDDDIFDFSQGEGNNLFGTGNEGGMNNDEDKEIESPEYKRGKSTGGGVLKGSHRYSTRSDEGVRKVILGKPQTYQHTKFVEIGMLLEAEEKATECIRCIKYLLENAQYIAKVALVELAPKDKGNPLVIAKPTDIPTNFTLLGRFFKMSTDDPFKKKQNWNNNKKTVHRDEEDKVYSKAVYGTLRISADMEINELVNAVKTEWQANNGLKMVVKEIQAPESKFVATIFFQSFLVPPEIVRDKFMEFLTKVMTVEKERESDMADEAEPLKMQVAVKLQVPKTFNIDNSSLDKVAWKIKQHRQAWQIEVPTDHYEETKRLIAEGKSMEGLVESVYTKHTIISEVMTREDTAAQNTRFMEVILKHGKYNYNMQCTSINGFGNMTLGVALAGDGAEAITGLEFLPSVLKLEGGFPAIAEIYQPFPGSPVTVVYLKCSEGEHMMAQLNKNPAAYIVHALMQIIGEDAARKMAITCCIPEHISEIDECTWDDKSKTLTTASESSQKKELDCFDAPFWNQAFDIEEMLELEKKEKNKINPETLFNLDTVGTIKSIHNRTKTKISFAGDGSNDDEASADSSIDSIHQLATDNHNTGATGKIPSNAQASAHVVSPKESVDGSVPAESG